MCARFFNQNVRCACHWIANTRTHIVPRPRGIPSSLRLSIWMPALRLTLPNAFVIKLVCTPECTQIWMQRPGGLLILSRPLGLGDCARQASRGCKMAMLGKTNTAGTTQCTVSTARGWGKVYRLADKSDIARDSLGTPNQII